MKKFLAILASLSMVTSSGITAISCVANQPGGNDEDRDSDLEKLSKNDFNNLLGASISQAKAMIIDNEYQISQIATNKTMYDKEARKVIEKFNPKDEGLNFNSSIGDVIKKYFGPGTDKKLRTDLNSENVQLGHEKGVTSPILSLIPSAFRTDGLEKIKDIIFKVLNVLIDGGAIGETVVDYMNQIYANKIDSTLNHLIDGLVNSTDFNIKGIVKDIKPFSAVISTFFSSFFKRNEFFSQARTAINSLFDPTSPKYLENSLYGSSTDPDLKVTPIANIPLSRVKAELLLSITKILKMFFVFPTEKDEAFKDIQPGTDQEVPLILSTFLLSIVKNEPLAKQDIKTVLLDLVEEIFRIMTIVNAYFSIFDSTKEFEPKDNQHLFSVDKNNYEFLSEQYSKIKTLGETSYVKDKAINLNYLVANLDYYFGSLKMNDKTSAYRFQQGLFLLFNDPSENYKERNSYDNRPSFLTDRFFDTLLIFGAKFTTGKSRKTIIDLYNDKNTKATMSEAFLRPIILGLINGDDMQIVLRLINQLIKILVDLVPELVLFEDYFKDINIILENGLKKPAFVKNTLHYLLTEDLRDLFNGTKVINEDLLNRWFSSNPEDKVNLQTLFLKPLGDLIVLFGGKQNTDIYLESLYNSSIPEIISLISGYLNNLSPELDVKKAKYEVEGDATNKKSSLKILNLDLPSTRQFILGLIGSTTESTDNVFSTIVTEIFSDSDENNSLVSRLGLNFKAVLEKLGMKGENTFTKDSFLGSLFQMFLPTTKPVTTPEIVLTKASYEVDLMGLWLKNLIDILEKLSVPFNYDKFILQLLDNDKIFNIKLKEDELKYFVNDPNEIESLAFYVKFNHPITLSHTDYLFRIKRLDVNKFYDFYNITSNKNRKD